MAAELSPMSWLSAGVPISLLVDLADPAGPDSPRIYSDEADDDAVSWLVPATA